MELSKYLDIISKELSNQISEEEQVYLNRWLEEKAENQALFLFIQQDYEKAKRKEDDFDIQTAYQHFLADQNPPPTTVIPSLTTPNLPSSSPFSKFTALISNHFSSQKKLKIALYVGLLLSVSGISFWMFKSTTKKVVAKKEARKIVLPDNSTVWLNKYSSITYTIPFHKRHVLLSGEAFFDIQSDETNPFVVFSRGARIEALGTSFNVRSFAADKKIEVTTETGKVQITSEKLSGTKFYNIPNKEGNRWSWRMDDNLIETVKNENHTLWAYRSDIDSLRFERQKLGAIFETLERLFEIKIELSDEGIQKCNYTGTFEKNNPEAILKSIATDKDLDFDKNSDFYHLSGRGCGKRLADPFMEEVLSY